MPMNNLYKEKMKLYHDCKIEKRKFTIGKMVLLFEFKLKLFTNKLKSKWRGLYRVTRVHPYSALELENKEVQNLNHYLRSMDEVKVTYDVDLNDALGFKNTRVVSGVKLDAL